MSMEKEIAALRQKHAAGNLTDFKLRRGIRKIKQKYGVDAPSNVTKIMSFLKKTPAEAGLFTPRQAMKLPKSPPKRPKNNTSKTTKKSEKTYHQINTQTGKVDFDKPKVTAAKRLQQEDKYKALKRINKTAKQSLKKKGK